MYRTIVAELTHTDVDHSIVRIALDEALRHRAHLVLHRTVVRPETCAFHVGQPPQRTGHDDRRTKEEIALATHHIETLRMALHLFARTEPMVSIGDPVVQLQFLARLYPAPLVVTAANSETVRTERIVAAVPCPVLVVPELELPAAAARSAELAAIA